MDLLLWRADEDLIFFGARGVAKDEDESSAVVSDKKV
jgi:hypothetical protein